jgi:hypothetical protein
MATPYGARTTDPHHSIYAASSRKHPDPPASGSGKSRPASSHTAPRQDTQAQDQEDEQDMSLPLLPSFAPRVSADTPIGRPPRNDEEKRELYLSLLALKNHRLTNKECAARLGVSERTIVNYLADSFYHELRVAESQDANKAARAQLAQLQQHVIKTLYELTDPVSTKSEFVRFSAAAKLGEWAGLSDPIDDEQKDTRTEVATFLTRVQEEIARGMNRMREEHQKVQAEVQASHTCAAGTPAIQIGQLTVALPAPVRAAGAAEIAAHLPLPEPVNHQFDTSFVPATLVEGSVISPPTTESSVPEPAPVSAAAAAAAAAAAFTAASPSSTQSPAHALTLGWNEEFTPVQPGGKLPEHW